MKRKVEQSVVKKAIEGDSEAFSKLYFALRGSIYGFAFRMLREVSAAEQITQEAFMFLIEHPKRFDPARGEILPFLCAIARNKIIARFRKHGTKFEIYESDMSEFKAHKDSEGDALDTLLNSELSEKIEEKLATLPPLQREVLILREIEELPYLEIARITGANLNQVKIRLHRARKNLAKKLRPYLAEEKEKYYEMCKG